MFRKGSVLNGYFIFFKRKEKKTMNILDGIGETLNNAYNDVSKKAKDASGIAKLSYKIKQKESFISMQYGAIGKAYFEDHKDDAEPAYEGVSLVNSVRPFILLTVPSS